MLKKFKTYVLLAIFGVVVGSSQGLQAKWINIETEWGSEGWWFEPSLGDKKATLRRLTKNNAPIKELEKLAAEIHKMDSSFLKVFSSLCYFQANLKILPKKLEGLFDEKTGTFMTPGAAKLLGVQPVSTLKKSAKKRADNPDIIIYFKKWYEGDAGKMYKTIKRKRTNGNDKKQIKKFNNYKVFAPIVIKRWRKQ